MTDAEFLGFSVNVKTLITATPTAYGLVAADATAYGLVHDAYASAYQTALDPLTRTRITIADRNAARDTLENSLRLLFNKVEGTPTVTDQQKMALGINVRKPPQPIQPPTEAPVMAVRSVQGRTVAIKLMQVDSESRGKPEGVAGAKVYSYIGQEPAPDDITMWKSEGSTSTTNFEIDFPVTVAAGSKVWLTAAWFSPRQASGPACEPISTYLGGGVVNQAA